MMQTVHPYIEKAEAELILRLAQATFQDPVSKPKSKNIKQINLFLQRTFFPQYDSFPRSFRIDKYCTFVCLLPAVVLLSNMHVC